MSHTISVPELAMLVLVGPSGAGKTTLAHRLARPSEVLSSDAFREMVRDDEADMGASADAFEVLHLVLEKRLRAGRFTIVDATNVRREDRAALVAIAKRFHVVPVAVVLDVAVDVCLAHNAQRPGRENSQAWVGRQHEGLARSLREGTRGLEREGFRHVHRLVGEVEIASVSLERTKMPADRREECGPFDVIGDVHGCLEELTTLLGRLDYAPVDGVWSHPSRRAIFVGDLVDRGPASIACLELGRAMVERGRALMVPGNHENKLVRALRGAEVRSPALRQTLAELDVLEEPRRTETRERLAGFLEGLPHHLVLEGGQLVVAHAGLRREMHLRSSGAVRAFALYGETTGEVDAFGLPERADWARGYDGEATVVYGHTPVPAAEWVNGTICIDTGCVFGGALTALRWPERELVQVPAARAYWARAVAP